MTDRVYTPTHVTAERWQKIQQNLHRFRVDVCELEEMAEKVFASEDSIIEAYAEGVIGESDLGFFDQPIDGGQLEEVMRGPIDALQRCVDQSAQDELLPLVKKLITTWNTFRDAGVREVKNYGYARLVLTDSTREEAIRNFVDYQLESEVEVLMDALEEACPRKSRFRVHYNGVTWRGRCGVGDFEYASHKDMMHRLIACHGDYTLHECFVWTDNIRIIDADDGEPLYEKVWGLYFQISVHDFSGSYLLTSLPEGEEWQVAADQFAAQAQEDLDELLSWTKWLNQK